MRVAEGRALRRISRCFPCMRRPSCGLALAWATKGRGPATKSKPAGHHCNDARVGEFLSKAFASGYATLCEKTGPGGCQEKRSHTAVRPTRIERPNGPK